MQLLAASIPAPILAGLFMALLAPALYRAAPRTARRVLPLVPMGLAGHFAMSLPTVVAGETHSSFAPWVAPLGLNLSWRLDGLSLLFAILITGVGALVTMYAGSYLAGNRQLGRLYGYLFLFMASMLGVVLTDNGIALFVFWELTSISSYFLIGFDHEREAARSAALQALLVTGVGGLALLAGVILLAQATGTYELSEMTRAGDLGGHPHYAGIVVLVLAAAFTKSAQLPFSFWLPRAMEAPAPVSAYLHAATMVKAGVYLLARMSPTLSGSDLWREALIWTGAATAVIGGALALGERHLKRVLAWSTVGALGVMVLLVGIGTPTAFQALAVFLAGHALYKGALFLVAGAVDHAVHELDVERLAGLRRHLPATAAAAGLAALSMGGVPPLLGYVAKELLYATTLGTGRLALTACAVVAGALFLAAALNAGIRPFWRRAEAAPPVHGVGWPLWATPLVLALAGLLFGIWPEAAGGLVRAAALAAAPAATSAALGLWHGAGAPLLLSGVTLALGLALFRGREALRRAARPLAPIARLGPARGYEVALATLGALARGQTTLLQRGSLQGYLVIVMSTTLVLVGFAVAGRGGLPSLPPVRGLLPHEVVVAGVILVSALSAVRASSRFASMISLGVVGLGVSLVFVLFGAPDLGITQLVVETLTVILLVLAFYHLPRFAELSSPRARARDVVLSLGVGALMTTLVLLAAEAQVAEPVSGYYGRVSLPEAHGRNVVNVILTDFRALDTMGEITVLAAAALGVVALLKLRTGGGGSP